MPESRQQYTPVQQQVLIISTYLDNIKRFSHSPAWIPISHCCGITKIMTRRDDEIKNLMGNHGYKGLPLSKIVLYLSEASKDIPPSEWETKALKSESENLTSPNVDSDDKIPPALVIKPKHRVDKTLLAFQQGQKAQKKRNWGISRKNKIPKRDNTYSGAFDPMD